MKHDANCGHCHQCGNLLRDVPAGEWCDWCGRLRLYYSHGAALPGTDPDSIAAFGSGCMSRPRLPPGLTTDQEMAMARQKELAQPGPGVG